VIHRITLALAGYKLTGVKVSVQLSHDASKNELSSWLKRPLPNIGIVVTVAVTVKVAVVVVHKLPAQ